MKKFFISLISSLLILNSFAEFNRDSFTDTDLSRFQTEIQSALQEQLHAYLESQGAPGGCIGIHYIEPIYICDGLSDTTNEISIKEDMQYRIASTTKTFTAVGILRLISEGKLTLNTTISQFFPDLAIPNKEIITIYHLLHMSSGIANYLGNYYSLEALQQEYTYEQLIQTGIDQGVEFAPGEGYSYSNTNYVMLGMIIEQLTELSYAQYIENLVKDLGLYQTYEPTASQLPEPFVRGYIKATEEGQLATEVDELNPSAAFATGSMISTVKEMTQWTNMLFDEQNVLDEQGMKDLLDFSVDMDAGKYGGGVEKYTEEKLGELPANNIVGKVANIMGYTSIMTYAVEERISIVVFINYENEMQSFLAANMAMQTLGIFKDIQANFEPENNIVSEPLTQKEIIEFLIVISLIFMALAFIRV